jgi:2-phospho-L-lactate guanylyltransferase (CobY/MobA/RfbA family)
MEPTILIKMTQAEREEAEEAKLLRDIPVMSNSELATVLRVEKSRSTIIAAAIGEGAECSVIIEDGYVK